MCETKSKSSSENLEERVAMLELLLSDLSAALGREVATHQVRVVDDAGVTRVVLGCRERHRLSSGSSRPTRRSDDWCRAVR